MDNGSWELEATEESRNSEHLRVVDWAMEEEWAPHGRQVDYLKAKSQTNNNRRHSEKHLGVGKRENPNMKKRKTDPLSIDPLDTIGEPGECLTRTWCRLKISAEE